MPSLMGLHGQGTIVSVKGRPAADPRYRVAVTMSDGHRVWRTARTRRAAERIRRELVEARELELDPTRQTLGGYLRSWIAGLRSAKNERVRPRTLEHYELVVEKHIIPTLGDLKLSAVTARRVQAWIDADEGKPRTVRHHHAVLRHALNVAVKQRLLAWNPASAVYLPDLDGAEIAKPLGIDDARKLLDATAGGDGKPRDRLHALWRLALVTGMREAELLGLPWDDVADGTITVRTQLQRLIPDEERAAAKAEGRKPRGVWVRAAPKAARSVKAIALDPATAAVLEEHRVTQAAERRADWAYFGLVFLTPDGNPYHRTDLRKLFAAACTRAGIEPRRFHDLRHSSAHLLRDAGVAEDTRMARLGHNTTAMARHYSGASQTQDQDAADRLGRALSG